MAGPAQTSQRGSKGPPAIHAAMQPAPKASQTLQAGGMLTAILASMLPAGVGIAKMVAGSKATREMMKDCMFAVTCKNRCVEKMSECLCLSLFVSLVMKGRIC